jgi:hypothetical protein
VSIRWLALTVAALLAAAALAWNAGEQHRRNCIDSGRIGCSVLPWDNGHPKPPDTGWGMSGAPLRIGT